MISAIADRISEEMLHEGLILEEDRELISSLLCLSPDGMNHLSMRW